MTDSTTPVLTPKRQLRRIPRTPGETRATILDHGEAGGRLAARLVRVEGGGVDRTTGQPLKVYFELTVKVPGAPEVTRTFAGQGDPIAGEWNARLAYLMAQHGVVDFSTSLGDLPPRLWPEPKNLTALARLAEGLAASGTRINRGDSHANLTATGGAAPSTRPTRSEAHSALPWWAGSDEPIWSAPGSRPEPHEEAASEPFLTLVPAF